MTTEREKGGSAEGTVAEVDRIRDIIFGPQMRLYEQQFQRVVGKLDTLSKQLEELRMDFEQRHADLASHTEQELARLREDSQHAVDRLGADLSSRLDKQASDFSARTGQLASDLRTQGQDLRSDLTQSVDRLDDDKASRHDLGDLLTEMGMRLKEQVGVADLLGQIGAAADSPTTD